MSLRNLWDRLPIPVRKMLIAIGFLLLLAVSTIQLNP